jgi:hypothetical protein
MSMLYVCIHAACPMSMPTQDLDFNAGMDTITNTVTVMVMDTDTDTEMNRDRDTDKWKRICHVN